MEVCGEIVSLADGRCLECFDDISDASFFAVFL